MSTNRNIAYITATGTVAINGSLTGATDGFIRAGNVVVYSMSLMAAGGSATARAHDAANGTATGTADTIVAATGSFVRNEYGGAVFVNGLRVVPNGTLTAVTVVYE